MTDTHKVDYEQQYKKLVSYLEGIELVFEMASEMDIELPGYKIIEAISERISIMEEENNCI